MAVVVTCSYYNTGTGNYATIEDRTTDDKQSERLIIRWTPDNYAYLAGIFGVRTKNVWWGNQGILRVGNRHDNSTWWSPFRYAGTPRDSCWCTVQ